MRTTTSELIELIIQSNQQDVGTSIPGHVTAFDPETQLAQLQIGIRTSGGVQLPIIIECPVQFSGGGGFVVEHQLDPNDEGIIVFSQRCIDSWIETGGVAEQPTPRMHSFNDAYFIPGIRSKPNVVTGFSNDGIKMRNEAGDKYLWLKASGDIEITAGSVSITGDLSATGTIEAPTIDASASLKAAGAEVVGHTHGGVQSGTSNTGPLV
jgi:hypothetical protein